MFAPAHHQATRFVVPVRRELAVHTIFNLLGPLTNPAGARRQLIGVSDPSFLETIAGALARLGVDRALVVAGEDGLDEISIGAATQVVEVNGEELQPLHADAGRRRARARRPSDGLRRRHAGGERGGHARDPARASRGARADLALINAGAAIYAAGVARDARGGRARPRARRSRTGARQRARSATCRPAGRYAPAEAAR